MNRLFNICAVVVTFNRLQKLQQALECYDKQTVPFTNIIIVDNHSTDGTAEFLEQWKMQPSSYGRYILTMPTNLGGSGGFYQGEKFALTLNPDWVFISDDDAYPDKNMVAAFMEFVQKHKEDRISAICAKVIFPDGTIINGCRSHAAIENGELCLHKATDEEYKMPFFKFNSLSYVGGFLSADALRSVGLVNPGYFIYQDDVEHSIRLSQYGPMYCVPSSIIMHDDLRNLSVANVNATLWKEYYTARNRTDIMLRHYPKYSKGYINSIYNQIRSHRDSTISALHKMYLEGIKDAQRGKLGIHDVYRPGLIVGEQKLPYPKWQWKAYYWFRRLKEFVNRKK